MTPATPTPEHCPIKPLNWLSMEKERVHLSARPLCGYEYLVIQFASGFDACVRTPTTSGHAQYIREDVATEDAAKALCEQHWRATIGECVTANSNADLLAALEYMLNYADSLRDCLAQTHLAHLLADKSSAMEKARAAISKARL